MTDGLCGAKHPTIKGVTCEHRKGVLNGRTPDRVAPSGRVTKKGTDVHVHRGRSEDGGVHRWEDEE